MKTKTKNFDCVDMMHRGALCIYEDTKGMTVAEELSYWGERHTEAVEALKPPREGCPAGQTGDKLGTN